MNKKKTEQINFKKPTSLYKTFKLLKVRVCV